MANARRKYSARRPTRRPTKRTRKGSAKPSKSLAKKIKTVIHAQTETKQAFYPLTLTAFNSGISGSGDAIQIMPNISRGTSDNNRIGDQSRAMSLSLRGHMYLTTSNNSAANARIGVRMFVVSPKYTPNFTLAQAAAPTWMPTLLKKGGTTTAFTGVISDLYAPVNTDAVTCHFDRVTYITIPYLYQGLGTGSVNTLASWDLKDSCKFFNIKLKCKNKLLRYDDSIDPLLPVNYGPVFLVGYCKLDGSSVDTVSTQLNVAFDSVFNYEDA